MCLVILMISLMMVACGRVDEGQANQYPSDGYLGLTQSNPNLLTNPTSRTYLADSQIIKRTLMNIDGVQRVRSFANGPHVVVYLTLEEGLSDAQREEIRQKAEKALSFNSPDNEYKVILR
jgi:hypothetical protein